MNDIPYLMMSILAYLLGSIPFGFIAAKLVKGIDIRKCGSGNIGATNVFRVVGKKWGILVFVLDALKGYLAVHLPYLFKGSAQSVPQIMFLGIAAILGHTFTLWLSFRGGKGVATSFGVFLGICPVPTLLSFGIFCVVFAFSRILSVGSLTAALTFPLTVYLEYSKQAGFIWYEMISIALAVFIFYTHRQNIQRLLKGDEKKLF